MCVTVAIIIVFVLTRALPPQTNKQQTTTTTTKISSYMYRAPKPNTCAGSQCLVPLYIPGVIPVHVPLVAIAIATQTLLLFV